MRSHPVRQARTICWGLMMAIVLGGQAQQLLAQQSAILVPSRPGISILQRSSPVESARTQRRPDPGQPNLPLVVSKSSDAGVEIDRLLTRLVLDSIPHQFEETKDWGGQTERWDGVKVWREGLKIETKRRKKKVNDGTWKKYSVQFRNSAEEFSMQVKNMRETRDEKLAFDVHFLAHLDIEGRQAKWVKGVQLYSVGVQGHTEVRLVVSVEVEVKIGGSTFPPDLVFVPVVTEADLVVDDFRIDRVGKAGGEIAQQVGKRVREELDEKIASKKPKLLNKINAELIKNQDDLRVPIAEAFSSKWGRAAHAFLPASVQATMGN
ncbi:MAG: hypothetical protein ACI814_005165 [Mariniblastus sp.]